MVTLSKISSFDNNFVEFAISHFDDFIINKNGDIELSVELNNSFHIEKKENKINVSVCRKSQVFYALSIILANIEKDFSFIKSTPFEKIYFMVDCSRAAVLNIATVKKLIVFISKLGFTGLELYTEDTYEITEEPYFGHLRGKYTKAEIKELDEFSKQYDIELIPCIQTLAHLDNIFLWPKFDEIHDIWDCLLIDNEKTYDLIDKMFKNVAESFSSRIINIGYDEAYYAGRGAYLDKNGYVNKVDLLYKHLKKVTEIGKKYGFKCIIYSDMFFNNKECLKKPDLPDNLEFNYWNYYSTNKKIYDSAFKKHLQVLNSVNYVAGAWKWLGITPFNKYGILRLKPGMTSAAENGIKTVTLSAWGDNGNECSLFAIMPQLVYFSVMAYSNDLSKDNLNKVCKAVSGIPFNDFLKLDIANGHKNKYYSILTNPAKYLMYNDPMCGLMDYHVDTSYNEYYKRCINILKLREKRSKNWSYLFKTQIALCDYLSVKSNMGNDLYKLYNENDKVGLRKYIEETVPKAIKKLDVFISAFREAWYIENKTFGFDVMEHRLGGQIQRLKEIIYRVEKYLSGEIERIEEFEQKKLPYNYPNEKGLVYKHNTKFILSPFFPVI